MNKTQRAALILFIVNLWAAGQPNVFPPIVFFIIAAVFAYIFIKEDQHGPNNS